MQGAISGRLSRQVLLFAWPRFEGTVAQVDDLLERVLKVSHSLGIIVIKRHDIEQFSKEKIIDRILSNR